MSEAYENLKELITRQNLQMEAGDAYFKRGLDYFRSGHVQSCLLMMNASKAKCQEVAPIPVRLNRTGTAGFPANAVAHSAMTANSASIWSHSGWLLLMDLKCRNRQTGNVINSISPPF